MTDIMTRRPRRQRLIWEALRGNSSAPWGLLARRSAAVALVLAPLTAATAQTVTLGAQDGACGGALQVAISVDQAGDLTAWGLTLNFNESCLSFVDVDRGANTGDWAAVSGADVGDGVVNVGGFAGAAAGINGPAQLALVNFICNGDNCGCSTAITATALVDGLEGYDVAGDTATCAAATPTPVPTATPTFTVGPTATLEGTPTPTNSVAPTATPTPTGGIPLPSLGISSATASCGQDVDVLISGANLEDVDAFGVRVSYDASCLTFKSAARTNATSEWAGLDASANTPGLLIVGGFAGSAEPITSQASTDLVRVTFTCQSATCDCNSALILSEATDDLADAVLSHGSITCQPGATATATPTGTTPVPTGTTAAPTATPVPTGTEPTPTATNTPVPTATPIVFEFEGPGGSDPEGWEYLVPVGFAPSTGTVEDGMLTVATQSNENTFGFWRSPLFTLTPPAAPKGGSQDQSIDVPAVDGNNVIVVRYLVRSDQTDATVVPQFRLRANTEDFQMGGVVSVESNADARHSPTSSAPQSLSVVIQPPANSTQFRAFFDALGFNPGDAPAANLQVDRVEVQLLDLSDLEETRRLEKSWAFDSDDNGWVAKDIAGVTVLGNTFVAPQSAATDSSLELTAVDPQGDNRIVFGWWDWGAPDNPSTDSLTLEGGRQYYAEFLVGTTVAEPNRVPIFRLRLNDLLGRISSYLEVNGQDASGAPSPQAARRYRVWLPPEVAVDSKLIVAFDLLTFPAQGDATDGTVSLEEAQVYSIPLTR